MSISFTQAVYGAFALILGLATAGQGNATIVVNGATTFADASVESGGLRLPPQSMAPSLFHESGIIVIERQSFPIGAGYRNYCRTAPRTFFGRLQMANFAGRFAGRGRVHSR